MEKQIIQLSDLCRGGKIESVESKNLNFFYNLKILEKEKFYWTYPIFNIFVASEFMDVLPALKEISQYDFNSYYYNAEKFFMQLLRNDIIDSETEKRLQKLNFLMSEKRINVKDIPTYEGYAAYYIRIADKYKVKMQAKRFCSNML